MYIYFKFGSKEHMLDLLKNGTIFCNSLAYFSKEDSSGRFDPDELVINIETEFDGTTIIGNVNGKNVRVYSKQTKDVVLNATGNLYCLYSLNIENVPANSFHVFHEKMSDFGSHVVIVKNSKVFIDRIVKKLEDLDIKFAKDFIKYVSMRDYHGIKDFFTKDKIYQHQKEYRIYLHTETDSPYIFSIGSIEDIAEIVEVQSIKEISMKDGKLLLHMS